MGKEQKAEVIGELEESLKKSSVAILTEYKGLTGAEMTQLHKKFREQKLEFRVVKNTLARRAAKSTHKDELAGILKGQSAMIVGFDDLSAPARAVTEYIRASKTALIIKGGIMGSRLLTVKDVELLAYMPSREVLLSRVVGSMQLPLYVFGRHMNSLLSGFARALQARADQLGQQAEAPKAEAEPAAPAA